MSAWSSYLDRFHHDRPGITEAVFARLERDGGSVEDWILGADVEDGRVLDVACGSAPLSKHLQSRWLGIDRSEAELALAHGRRAGPLVRARATALPIATEGVDVVVCMMALMLLEPLDQAVRELGRAVRSDGRVVIVLPATRPLAVRDRARYARLLLALRRRRFDYPNSDTRIERALEHGGFEIVASERRSYCYPVDRPDAARLLVDSLYLPGVSRERIDAACGVALRWVGTSIGIPLRRLVAVR